MRENKKATATGASADIAALIESSSLGTPEARSARDCVDPDDAEMVLRLAERRRRTGMVGRWVEPVDDRHPDPRPTDARPTAADSTDSCPTDSHTDTRGRPRHRESAAFTSVTVFESARETVVVTTIVTPKARRWRLIGAAEGGAARTVRRRGMVVPLPGGFGVPAVRRAVIRDIGVQDVPGRESLVRDTLVRGTYDSVRRYWYVVAAAAAVCVLSVRE